MGDVTPDIERLYFGCWDWRLGHYLRTEQGTDIRFDYKTRRWDVIGTAEIDGALTPREDRSHGAAKLSHVGGWTILALHDYSRDTRPGSNAALLLRGTHNFDAVLADAREHFAEQVRRIEAHGPITLAETVNA